MTNIATSDIRANKEISKAYESGLALSGYQYQTIRFLPQTLSTYIIRLLLYYREDQDNAGLYPGYWTLHIRARPQYIQDQDTPLSVTVLSTPNGQCLSPILIKPAYSLFCHPFRILKQRYKF